MKKSIILLVLFTTTHLLSIAQVITDKNFQLSKPLSYIMLNDNNGLQEAPDGLCFSLTIRNGSPLLRIYVDFSSGYQETINEWTIPGASIIKKPNTYVIADLTNENIYASCVENNNKWALFLLGFSSPGESGTQQSQMSQANSSCPSTVKDYDGNTYNTVMIGKQCWMKENLRTTHYANGSSISLGNISKYSFTYAYRYQPDDNSSNVSTYGYLYNWPAVMHGASGSEANPSGVQGICPSGWHVPSEAEWRQLKDYVGSQSKFVCGGNRDNIAKALSSTAGWSSQYRALGESRYVNNNFECSIGNNLSANNGTGFSALPAGEFYASEDGENYEYNMYGFGTEADFWTSTSSGTDFNGKQRANRVFLIGHCDRYGECRTLDINHVSLSSDAHSVRCIRD